VSSFVVGIVIGCVSVLSSFLGVIVACWVCWCCSHLKGLLSFVGGVVNISLLVVVVVEFLLLLWHHCCHSMVVWVLLVLPCHDVMVDVAWGLVLPQHGDCWGCHGTAWWLLGWCCSSIVVVGVACGVGVGWGCPQHGGRLGLPQCGGGQGCPWCGGWLGLLQHGGWGCHSMGDVLGLP